MSVEKKSEELDNNQQEEEQKLEGGSYEVLKNRLHGLNVELQGKLEQLNFSRQEIFGTTDLSVIGSERVETENNCIPRDVVGLGDHLLFGYNVYIGLKSTTQISDIFSFYHFNGKDFSAATIDPFSDANFQRDFGELFKYYKHASFLQFIRTTAKLLLIFKVSESVDDIKIFQFRLDQDYSISYIDDRGDLDYRLPDQHDFEWVSTTRDDHIQGEYPHISILDKVFVECTDGTLTIKVEDNTSKGQGIYEEPVENEDQILDDASIYFANLGGLILLKILPYRENKNRYFIYNCITEQVSRVDAIENACIQLPENHGLIYPQGCYLNNGELNQFDESVDGMKFLRQIRSPNGEDFLYIFYHPESGQHILIQYNLISKKSSTPIFCHGYSFYEDGTMVIFIETGPDPSRSHPMQIWKTPFCGETYEIPQENDSFLFKIGNRDLVRGISEAYSISRLVSGESLSLPLYQEIVKACKNLLDRYHWLSKEEAFNLAEIVSRLKETTNSALEEFQKVERIRKNTRMQFEDQEKAVQKVLLEIQGSEFVEVNGFVKALERIRTLRGEVIALRDLNYANLDRVDLMDRDLSLSNHEVCKDVTQFLLKPDSLDPYQNENQEIQSKVEKAEKVAEIKIYGEDLELLAQNLDLLTDTINNLEIEDATQTARIVDSITDIYSSVNRTRALVRNRIKDLGIHEATAEFSAQFKLISQSITNYIGMCHSTDKVEEYMTKVMVTIEELESKFADYEEFSLQLIEKRDEAYNAFTQKKQVLEEEKKRAVGSLVSSAERILKSILNRSEGFKDMKAVNAYFASDIMVEKLRKIIDQLYMQEESVRADDLNGQLKSSQDQILRSLRDRLDLFTVGENSIQLGGYTFSVNTQNLELTTLFKDSEMFFHLTGTDFYERINHKEFLSTKKYWNQTLCSEDSEVYRSEYLSYKILREAQENRGDLSWQDLVRLVIDDNELNQFVSDYASSLYEEGYEKGIHDQDAAKILKELVHLQEHAGLLRYDSVSRSLAMIFWWVHGIDKETQTWRDRLKSMGEMVHLFPRYPQNSALMMEIQDAIGGMVVERNLDFLPHQISQAGEYLYHELQDREELTFTINQLADKHFRCFEDFIKAKGQHAHFKQTLDALNSSPENKIHLAYDWVSAFLNEQEDRTGDHFAWEIVAMWVTKDSLPLEKKDASTYVKVKGLLGQHRVITQGEYELYLDLFQSKLESFSSTVVVGFKDYLKLRSEIIEDKREVMKLSTFKPRVMGGFVRNRLINNVYLKLVGANFAKQMGSSGKNQRADQMGLLLLISPPGYGKTTLMEYVANRLGLTFMKINGPAIGHQVTSLDPEEANNATAREELCKLNLSLEMGNNVMIYLDDIQHLNPEFLQKFISLCDAQRKIEGVYNGITKTYDLRGKKVSVVMAGNPYTETGEKFQIPDMLSNRADTYNLGDISSSASNEFELSFIENCMTSNGSLSKISNYGHSDIYNFMKIAETGSKEGLEFEHNYGVEESREIVEVLKRLMQVRKVVLRVNEEYIYSASQEDHYRTEPAFKLQGSYRNMNRITEKVVAIMTEEEVGQLVFDNYYNDAQTLSDGTESNLLKFKEMIGTINKEEEIRWQRIKDEFSRRNSLGGDEDQMTKMLMQIADVNQSMKNIGSVLRNGLEKQQILTGPVEENADGSIANRFVVNLEKISLGLKNVQKVLDKKDLKGVQANQEVQREIFQFTENLNALNKTFSTILKEGIQFNLGS